MCVLGVGGVHGALFLSTMHVDAVNPSNLNPPEIWPPLFPGHPRCRGLQLEHYSVLQVGYQLRNANAKLSLEITSRYSN